jgi:hypothetical protein
MANLVREEKRPQVEKVVAATERILRGKDDSKVKTIFFKNSEHR